LNFILVALLGYFVSTRLEFIELKYKTHRFKAQVIKIISKAKAKPSPTIIPYPKPCDNGAVKVVVSAMAVRLEITRVLGIYSQRQE